MTTAPAPPLEATPARPAAGRRRLIVLAPSFPFPPQDGVQLRLGNLLRRLPADWSVDLLCPDDVAEPVGAPLPAPLVGTGLRLPRDPLPGGLAASPLAQALRPEASLIWKSRSAALAGELRRRLAGAQGVLAVGLQMAQYLELAPPGMPTALDNYNLESAILERLAATRTGLKRLHWRREAAKLRRAETRLLGRARHVWAISDVDRAAMQPLSGASRLATVPMGIDVDYFSATAGAPASPPRFTFVGAFGWHVNDDAAAWFVAEAWPLVRRALPDAEFHLVGRGPGPAVRGLAAHPGVTVTGTVPDVRPHLAASTAMVVPLRYGSGVRTKILEAFAAGRPVVATLVGAEGLDVRDGEHLLLAADAPALAAACVRLAREPETAAALVAAGRALVAEQDRRATALLHDAFRAAFEASA